MTTSAGRLSGHDQSFLFEQGSALQVSGLICLDAGPNGETMTEQRARRLLAERIHLLPRHRQIPVPSPSGLGPPRWVDDPNFDLGHHVRSRAESDEGVVAALNGLTGVRVPVTASPWDAWVLGGPPGGALLLRWHHSMLDGMSGIAVARVIFDVSPDAAQLEPPPWTPAPVPSAEELVAEAMAENVAASMRLAMESTTNWADPAAKLEADVEFLDGWLDLHHTRPRRDRPSAGGPTRVELTAPLLEERLRRAAGSLGTTVEHAVLAVVAGAMSRLHVARGEPVSGRTMRTLVPVALARRQRSLVLGNAATFYLVDLPLDGNASRRLGSISERVTEARRRHMGAVTRMLQWLDDLPPWLVSMVAGASASAAGPDAVVSYVRGPRRPLWLGGLPHRATYAALPVSDTVPVAVGAVGLGGALGMSVTARSGALPEVAFFAKALETSFAEVVGLGGS